jgi:hypothetical protein
LKAEAGRPRRFSARAVNFHRDGTSWSQLKQPRSLLQINSFRT